MNQWFSLSKAPRPADLSTRGPAEVTRQTSANLISLWIQNHYVTQKRSQYTTWYNFITHFCVSTTVLTVHCDMRNGPNKPNAKLHISFFGLALALPYLFSSRFSASKVSGLWMFMDVYGSTMFLLFHYTKEEKIETHIKHIDHIYSNRNNQQLCKI